MTDYRAEFARLINGEVEKKHISGANLMVLQNGKELIAESYGYASLETKVPMKRDTIFRMFSMSKTVTSAAVMILMERGLIDLYNPVSWYLSGFRDQKVWTPDGLVPVEREVTIRDLLNMTSGVCYPGEDTPAHHMMGEVQGTAEADFACRTAPHTVEIANRMGRCPLAFQPGEKWMYGYSADILGAVVEVVSGIPYGEFLKRELFEPLEMVDTGFQLREDQMDRLAGVYELDWQAGTLDPWYGSNLTLGNSYDKVPLFESGGAGLLSTIEDFSHFGLMLVNGGVYKGKRILGRHTVQFMRTNQLTEQQKVTLNWDSLKGYGYGNLMRVLEDKAAAASNASLSEFGWDGWLGTYIIMSPADNSVILYFVQKTNTGTDEITRRVRAIAYGMLE